MGKKEKTYPQIIDAQITEKRISIEQKLSDNAKTNELYMKIKQSLFVEIRRYGPSTMVQQQNLTHIEAIDNTGSNREGKQRAKNTARNNQITADTLLHCLRAYRTGAMTVNLRKKADTPVGNGPKYMDEMEQMKSKIFAKNPIELGVFTSISQKYLKEQLCTCLGCGEEITSTESGGCPIAKNLLQDIYTKLGANNPEVQSLAEQECILQDTNIVCNQPAVLFGDDYIYLAEKALEEIKTSGMQDIITQLNSLPPKTKVENI